MKIVKLIPKIAFFISVAALVFSVITLIRTLVLHQTSYIWLSVLQVIGTALIMGICAAVIIISKNNNSFEEPENSEINQEDNENLQDNSNIKEENKYDNIFDLPLVEDRDMDESGLIDREKL